MFRTGIFSVFKHLGSGRIGRLGYTIGLLLLFATVVLKLEMVARAPLPEELRLALTAGRYGDAAAMDLMTGLAITSNLLFLPMLSFAMIFLNAQRLRDLGISGWVALGCIVPFGLAVMAAPLMLLPSQSVRPAP